MRTYVFVLSLNINLLSKIFLLNDRLKMRLQIWVQNMKKNCCNAFLINNCVWKCFVEYLGRKRVAQCSIHGYFNILTGIFSFGINNPSIVLSFGSLLP